jgi:hypothetical protein
LRNIYLTFFVGSLIILALKISPGRVLLHQDIFFINAFFLALSVFIHRMVLLGNSLFPKAAPMVFLGATFLRMLLALIALAMYVVAKTQTREQGLLLGLWFFLLYLLYGFIEIKSFLATLRRGLKNQSKI